MVWDGLILSHDEIDAKYNIVFEKFHNDRRKTIPRIELTECIAEAFEIPNDIADAYVTIGLNRFSTDWCAVLNNVVRLMKVQMVHDIFEVLRATGEDCSIENAKKEANKTRRY